MYETSTDTGEWNARDIHQQSATICDKCHRPEFPDCMITAGKHKICLNCAEDELTKAGYSVSFNKDG